MNDKILTVLEGDCREKLRELESESINCCVTSPPYFGLRSYLDNDDPMKSKEIGAEQSPQEFIQALVSVFDEVKRVLRSDGILFVNIADSYYNYRPGKGQAMNKQTVANSNQDLPQECARRGNKLEGLKEKDRCLIPQRFVIAMQDAGWWVRDEIAWIKKSCMPESVTDRFTRTWEPIFMFTKSPHYFFDVEAVKEPSTSFDDSIRNRDISKLNNTPGRARMAGLTTNDYEMRRMRNAWILSPEPLKEGHYAAYPTEIPRRCILAGCPVGGTVLDPFGGSGTTAKVAIELGRKAVLIELNANYLGLIEKRTQTTIGFGW